MAKKIVGAQLSELHEFLKLDSEQLAGKKARLFPQPKSKSEGATTSVFLASLSAVKEYREFLLKQIGGAKICNRNTSLHVYTEIPNEDGSARPDGLIVLTSGRNNPTIEWACFVESKVGPAVIDQAQIETYIDFAQEIGIPTIVSISNQITAESNVTPYSTRKKKIQLYHWSWPYLSVMSTKLLQAGVEDEDHAYILGELRRFFDANPDISSMTNMGKEWKENVQAICECQIGKVPKESQHIVAELYAQEETDVSLQMTDKTQFDVHLLLKRDEDRRKSIADDLSGPQKVVTSTYAIATDKNWQFTIELDFTRKAVTYRRILPISTGKAQAQTTALLKRMEQSGRNSDIQIVAVYKQNKKTEPVSLATLYSEKDAKPFKQYSTVNKDLGDEVKHFDIYIRQEFLSDFNSPKNFILRLEQGAEDFINQVVAYTQP